MFDQLIKFCKNLCKRKFLPLKYLKYQNFIYTKVKLIPTQSSSQTCLVNVWTVWAPKKVNPKIAFLDFFLSMFYMKTKWEPEIFLRDTNVLTQRHQIFVIKIFGFIHKTSLSFVRPTCTTSTLIDHILASFPSRVSQKVLIDVSIFDHQLIFCTWKSLRQKTGGTHKYLIFRSFKSYILLVLIKRLLSCS